MCKINSSEYNILLYKCNDLKFCEHEFNSAQSENFVSTNLKTPVKINERIIIELCICTQ